MKTESDPQPSQTPFEVIYVIVGTYAVLAFIGFITMAIFMFCGGHADPQIVTAFVGMLGGVIGSLGAFLVNTRQQKNGNGEKVTDATDAKVDPPAVK